MGRSLGDLEQLLLLALLRLDGEATGIRLLAELEDRTGRELSPGALYNVMQRLETRGLVSSSVGEESPSRGGRRRKIYRMEPAGSQELAVAWGRVRDMAAGLESQLDALAPDNG